MKRRVVLIALLLMALSACTSTAGETSTAASASQAPTAAPGPEPRHWTLVGLGNSDAQASDCPGCTDMMHLYAKGLAAATGVPVDVKNDAAIELSNVPSREVSGLLYDVLGDPSMRDDIANADIVVVMIGHADTPLTRLDDPCNAWHGSVIDWAKVTIPCIRRVVGDYKQTLDEVFTEIDELRGCGVQPGIPPCSQAGKKTPWLRLVTAYNDWFGGTTDPNNQYFVPPDARGRLALSYDLMVKAQCEIVRYHGGRCADIYHAFNGQNGMEGAGPYLAEDYTHLNQRGHRVAADLLLRLGVHGDCHREHSCNEPA